MRHLRISFKRQQSGLCNREHTHIAYWKGASDTPIAFINKTPYGYGVFRQNGNGCGLHDNIVRAKMAIVELIIDRPERA